MNETIRAGAPQVPVQLEFGSDLNFSIPIGQPLNWTIFIEGGTGPFTINRTGWLDPGLRISGSNNLQYTETFAPINPLKVSFNGMYDVQKFDITGTPTGTGQSGMSPSFRLTVTDATGTVSNSTSTMVGSRFY